MSILVLPVVLKWLLGLGGIALLAVWIVPEVPAADPWPMDALRERAAAFRSVIAAPDFETTPGALRQSVAQTQGAASAALDALARVPARQATFENTVRALDGIHHGIALAFNRSYLIMQTHPEASLREAAAALVKELQAWWVGLDYREDVYAAVRAYAGTRPALQGEDAKLLEETLRDFRRAGLGLGQAERVEVEALRKELATLVTDFESNITRARQAVVFTRAELAGVPESFLAQPGLQTGPDEFTVLANVTWHYTTVMENAGSEAVRKRLFLARFNLARETNLPLLEKLVGLRARLARKLGYPTWADYQLEPKMAKTAGAARQFLDRLKTGLQPKFDAELAELRALKTRATGQADPPLHKWDWRYYSNQLKKERYTVDAEQLRVFFPYEKVLRGMFQACQHVFGLRIEPVAPPAVWAPGVQLQAILDAATGEPLGLCYLDMHPREGKYNHFAQFELIEGKLLPDGQYQRPTVGLICNFPPPAPDKPSLLAHQEVVTLFHEFGHALHSLLTRARHRRFSGTSVPRDFVEAPSQVLESWAWDKRVLDSFAADYRDESRKIPGEILDRLKAARLATIGVFYRRQLAMGLLDMALHSEAQPGPSEELVRQANATYSETFLPLPDDTAFIAYFGHLGGYDAAYYGYAWADAIAADLATVFEQSSRGFSDAEAGRRLRDEIYAVGGSREVQESIQQFLGRETSIEPFLKSLGIA